jgi:hypothetical protein
MLKPALRLPARDRKETRSDEAAKRTAMGVGSSPV